MPQTTGRANHSGISHALMNAQMFAVTFRQNFDKPILVCGSVTNYLSFL
jgi:hypothetical protein